MLTLSFAVGCEPGKWQRRFAATPGAPELDARACADPVACVLDGTAVLGLVRLPDPRVAAAAAELHKVELYDEEPGVAVPRESIFAEAADPVVAADLDGEVIHARPAEDGRVDTDEVAQMLSVVGANVGVVLGPRPLLTVLAKRQVLALALADPEALGVPRTRIALIWKKSNDSEAVQDFVGITKGRLPSSSRSRSARNAAAKSTGAPEKNTKVSSHRHKGRQGANNGRRGGRNGAAKNARTPRRPRRRGR